MGKQTSDSIVGQLGVEIGLHVRVKVWSWRMIMRWWDRTSGGSVVDRLTICKKINHNVIVIISESSVLQFESKSEEGTRTLAPKAFGWVWREASKYRTTAEILKESCPCPFRVEEENVLDSCEAESHCAGIGVRRFGQCNIGWSALQTRQR